MSSPLFAKFLRDARRNRSWYLERIFNRSYRAVTPTLLTLSIALILAMQVRADSKIRVAFVGDSSADGLWGGVTRVVSHDNCLKDLFELGRYGKNGTGLARANKFDWADEVGRINDRVKPHLFVISLGLNDRQDIVEASDGRVTVYGAPEWPSRYRNRISAVIKNATVSGAGVVWVGLASMRNSVANADADAKNSLFAAVIDTIGVKGVQFVRPWRASNKETETFSTYVSDSKGVLIQVRAADGIHFTPAGDELVAAYLLPKIIANLSDRNFTGIVACQQK